MKDEEVKKYDSYLESEDHTIEQGGVDEDTGLPYQFWDIGMVRNAKEKKVMKVFTKPSPHVSLKQNIPLRGWYKAKNEPRNVRPRPCFTEALLTQPYGGTCPIKCSFCYVNNGTRGYRGQGMTVVDEQYADKMAKQFQGMDIAFSAYITSFTEPFQKIEEVYHNTQLISEVITSFGLPLFYLTRQPVPDWAIEYLLKNKYSYQQFSIITSNEKDYKRLTPGAISIEKMLEQIRKISSLGIYVSIQINPIVAGITSNEDIIELMDKLKEAGANHVIFKFIEIVAPAKKALIEKMRKLFGDRADKLEELLTQYIGGVYTIEEKYRLSALDMFMAHANKIGLTMGLCYEYKYARDDKGIILSKTGVSIGKEYCTADQCHGMRVPLHIKNKETGKFEPFEGCPPTGCLYCSDYHEKPPCGIDYLFEAKALTPKDFKRLKPFQDLKNYEEI